MNVREIGLKISDKLGLELFPIGMYFTDKSPENAVSFKSKGNGCILPLIFTSSKGKVVAIDQNTTGWDCSAFYLGYKDWIFNGIECFLSNEEVYGREPEHFFKTPELAKTFVEKYKPEEMNEMVTVFKPLSMFEEHENPEIVIFFSTPDELSGLVYLLNYAAPENEDIVVTRFISGCGSIVTYPMKLKREGKKQAVWGMQDISVRKKLPENIMSLTMPYELLVDINEIIDESFIKTENWSAIMQRKKKSV